MSCQALTIMDIIGCLWSVSAQSRSQICLSQAYRRYGVTVMTFIKTLIALQLFLSGTIDIDAVLKKSLLVRIS